MTVDIDASSVATRFWQKVDRRGDDECWPWLGGVSAKGYGSFWFVDGPKSAHRVAWWLAYGQWPLQTIDHLCNTPGCQNVLHMQDVSSSENTRLRDERNGNPAARTDHCVNGHSFADDNLYIDRHGHRVCRACGRAKAARYYERKRLEARS